MLIDLHASRRRFLKSSLVSTAAIGVGCRVPGAMLSAAGANSTTGKVLVVVQLTGGNDGLNTLVPYRDDIYYRLRPKLAVSPQDVVRLDDECGLHPAAAPLEPLLASGDAAIVRGVGYDQPNRSHFESMDIWHTCRRKDEPREAGWLGRFFDTDPRRSGPDVVGMHLGRESQPLALLARHVSVPTIADLSQFRLRGENRQALQELLSTNAAANNSAAAVADRSGRMTSEAMTSSTSEMAGDSALEFLQSSTAAAVDASSRIAQAAGSLTAGNKYPDTPLGQKLQIVANLISAGLQTSVYYVQLDGFDTHANQPDAHASLLRTWADAMAAFVGDLDAQGHKDRVSVMTFSEFGRRVAENASDGTDHGAAGPMFFCGGGLRPGIHGPAPDLQDLLDGDIKPAIDFRRLYAAVLENWLGVAPERIVGDHRPLEIFA